MPSASFVPQAVLAQLDAADDPEAGSLKKVQANATKSILSACCLQEGAFVFRKWLQRVLRLSKKLSPKHVSIQCWCWQCTSGCAPFMPALGMQAEHQEEVGSEDAVPPIEAGDLRCNTGSSVAHIHWSAVAFL